jgi:hypothetical protein
MRDGLFKTNAILTIPVHMVLSFDRAKIKDSLATVYSQMHRTEHLPAQDSDFDAPALSHQSPVPVLTRWYTKFSCCGLHLNYVPAIRKHFINHWELQICMPITVLFIIYSSLTVYLLCQLRTLPTIFGWKTTVYLIFTSFLFGYSYLAVILVGPGYLPFYYPFLNSFDPLSGMVTNDEQLCYVKNLTLPPRTGYFKSVRRIVIRPDHFCAWTVSFIGRKNHKLFFLFNLWGVFYTAVFTGTSLISVIKLAEKEIFVVGFVLNLIYVVLGLTFMVLTGSFAVTMLLEVSRDNTSIEQMKKKNREEHRKKQRTCIENWEIICGGRDQWYCWMCPTRPFLVCEDRELLDELSEQEPASIL